MLKKLHYLVTILFVLSCLVTTEALAKSQPPKFSAGAMLLAGKGKMGNGLADAPERDMTYIPVGLFAGVNFKKFRLGLNYEYMMSNQNTDPVQVANTNTSGTGTSIGARLEYYDGKQSIGAVYRASSTYNLEKQTVAGENATYTGSGFSLQYTRQIKKRFGFVIDYTTETFTDSLVSGNVKWDRIGLGIVFTNFAGTGRGR
jgi:hypothetical protein